MELAIYGQGSKSGIGMIITTKNYVKIPIISKEGWDCRVITQGYVTLVCETAVWPAIKGSWFMLTQREPTSRQTQITSKSTCFSISIQPVFTSNKGLLNAKIGANPAIILSYVAKQRFLYHISQKYHCFFLMKSGTSGNCCIELNVISKWN